MGNSDFAVIIQDLNFSSLSFSEMAPQYIARGRSTDLMAVGKRDLRPSVLPVLLCSLQQGPFMPGDCCSTAEVGSCGQMLCNLMIQ